MSGGGPVRWADGFTGHSLFRGCGGQTQEGRRPLRALPRWHRRAPKAAGPMGAPDCRSGSGGRRAARVPSRDFRATARTSLGRRILQAPLAATRSLWLSLACCCRQSDGCSGVGRLAEGGGQGEQDLQSLSQGFRPAVRLLPPPSPESRRLCVVVPRLGLPLYVSPFGSFSKSFGPIKTVPHVEGITFWIAGACPTS
jgi:hypothetical protein